MKYEIVRPLTPLQSAGLKRLYERARLAKQAFEEALLLVTGDQALGVDPEVKNVIKAVPVNRVEEALTNGHG